MAEMTWAKHPGTGNVAEVPVEAIPQLRQSGWEPMTKKEIADMEQAAADEVAAAEKEMREKAAPVADEPAPADTDDAASSRGRAKNTKGTD